MCYSTVSSADKTAVWQKPMNVSCQRSREEQIQAKWILMFNLLQMMTIAWQQLEVDLWNSPSPLVVVEFVTSCAIPCLRECLRFKENAIEFTVAPIFSAVVITQFLFSKRGFRSLRDCENKAVLNYLSRTTEWVVLLSFTKKRLYTGTLLVLLFMKSSN